MSSYSAETIEVLHIETSTGLKILVPFCTTEQAATHALRRVCASMPVVGFEVSELKGHEVGSPVQNPSPKSGIRIVWAREGDSEGGSMPCLAVPASVAKALQRRHTR